MAKSKKYRVARDGMPLTKALSFERATMRCEQFSRKSPHLSFTVVAA